MPTFVLATTSNPGTAQWQDSTTIPGGIVYAESKPGGQSEGLVAGLISFTSMDVTVPANTIQVGDIVTYAYFVSVDASAASGPTDLTFSFSFNGVPGIPSISRAIPVSSGVYSGSFMGRYVGTSVFYTGGTLILDSDSAPSNVNAAVRTVAYQDTATDFSLPLTVTPCVTGNPVDPAIVVTIANASITIVRPS